MNKKIINGEMNMVFEVFLIPSYQPGEDDIFQKNLNLTISFIILNLREEKKEQAVKKKYN